ncbi:hypothetical protein HCJ70_16470 [Listeria booriae]|uniref:hypothetical protein n=1 Tax=Listeria booriae TaxID=1552123 RepID=UPI001624CAD8|nr:hypothetical protein [Listeria booriae]MBC2100648.1 hypothetical protein [Listeria booriae]
MLIQLETNQIVFLIIMFIIFFISTYFFFQFIKTYMVLKGFLTSAYIFQRAIRTFLRPVKSFNRHYKAAQDFRNEMVKEGATNTELKLFDTLFLNKKRLFFRRLRTNFFSFNDILDNLIVVAREVNFKVVITARNSDKDVKIRDVFTSVISELLFSLMKKISNKSNPNRLPRVNIKSFNRVKKHLDELEKKNNDFDDNSWHPNGAGV